MTDWIEPIPLADLYSDGIAEVENLGTNFRTVYFVWQRSPSGVYGKVAVAKIVRPMSSLAKTGYLHLMMKDSRTPQLEHCAAN